MVNHVIVHSPIQHAVNAIVTNLPTNSQVVTPQPRVMVQKPVVTIQPSGATLPQLTTIVLQ